MAGELSESCEKGRSGTEETLQIASSSTELGELSCEKRRSETEQTLQIASSSAKARGARCEKHLQPSTKLSEAALERLDWNRNQAQSDRQTRVTVWTLGGTQIGLPGVGEGQNALTFPLSYTVGDALRAGTWLRFATAEEVSQSGPVVFFICLVLAQLQQSAWTRNGVRLR